MYSRNLFVLDFVRRFFVSCAQIFKAYAVRTLMKFGCDWRKISHTINTLFPSQYYALSVTKEYLALEGGPSDFPQGFSCPAVLWILPLPIAFMYEALTLSGRASQPVPLTNQLTYAVRNPSMHARWFRLLRFRSPLLPESMFLSFPPAT